jgi:cobalt/nickel transport system ATP-binding protein
MTSDAFCLSAVVYRYQDGGAGALDGLSLCIPAGQRVALLGANGSGKSTLLRLLDALYFASSGTVTAFGETLNEECLQDEAWSHAFRRRVGLVFQNPDVQLFNATVFDELAFGPLQMGWPREQIIERVDALLAEMHLTHLRERPPHRLSGGEKKRVALASVLILDPEVVLLDEPTAALDPESQSQLIEILIGWAGSGKTVVLATHDLDIVEDVADLCLVLKEGRLIAEGTPAAILADESLLRQTGLIHAHRHVHDGEPAHVHHHLHRRLK